MPHRWRWRGYRRVGGVVFLLAAAAVVAELLVIGLRTHQLHPSSTASTAAPAQVAAAAATTPTTIWAPLPPPPPPTTTTIAPPAVAPDLVTYTFPAPTRITVHASGDCWVEAKPSATGTAVSTVNLTAGQTESFMSPIWLRFGNPTQVTVTADHMRLQLPSEGPGDLLVGSA
jgi:hypothetical protein